MKYTFLIIVLSAGFLIIGCSKSNQAEPAVLVAKWRLIKDSTASSIDPAIVVTNKYTGTAADYFDFRADGICYTKEGNVYDTLVWQRIDIDKINIEKFGFSSRDNPCTLDPFTLHNATITSPFSTSPGGFSYRQVVLRR